jgi:hypothetical protein
VGVAAALLALVTLVVAGVAACVSQRAAFSLLFASIVLVPASLSLPTGGLTSQLSVHRVVMLGVLAGLVWRHREGRIWRVTPIVLAFLVYLAVVLLTGIVFTPTVIDVGGQVATYVNVVEQLVVLVVCTALVRADPDAVWFLRPISAVLLLSAGIAAIEHATGGSWCSASRSGSHRPRPGR